MLMRLSKSVFSASDPHTESISCHSLPKKRAPFRARGLAPGVGTLLLRPWETSSRGGCNPEGTLMAYVLTGQRQGGNTGIDTGRQWWLPGDPLWQLPSVGRSADRHHAGHLLPGQWCGNKWSQGTTRPHAAGLRAVVTWSSSGWYTGVVESAGGIYRRKKRDYVTQGGLNAIKSLALCVIFIKSKLLDQNGCSNWFS